MSTLLTRKLSNVVAPSSTTEPTTPATGNFNSAESAAVVEAGVEEVPLQENEESFGKDISSQPSSGKDISSQPSSGRDISSQPSSGKDISSQPSSGRDISSQPSSGNPSPKQFSPARKNVILAIVALAGILGPLTSTIFLAVVRDLRVGLDTSLSVINMCIALFVLFMCISPFVWAPLSEMIGRKPVFIVSATIFAGASAGCALSNSAALFVPMRILQAFGSACGQVVGAGVIADIFEVHERGTRMGIFFGGPLLGPVLGPIVGGYINESLGWRWVFWIPSILGATVALLMLFFLPETLANPKPISWFNPLSPLLFFKDRNIALMTIYPGVTYGLMYFLLTNYSEMLTRAYGWKPSQAGMSFLAGGIGNIIGTFTGGWLADWARVRALRLTRGPPTPEMRLGAFWVGAILMPIGFIIFGWSLQAQAHPAIPLVGYFIEGFGQLMGFSITNTYFVDAYASRAASVIGAATFVRGICGMITPLFAVQMQHALNIGWTYTTLAIISLLCAIPVLLVRRYGEIWRRARLLASSPKRK